MIQTKRTRGNRTRSSRSVSTEKRVPKAASIPVATIRLPSAIDRAEANRSAIGAIPARGFSGLPGETNSQT